MSSILTVRRSHYRGILDGTKTGTTRPELSAVLHQHRRRQMASQAPGLDGGWRHTLSDLLRKTAGRQVQKAIAGHTTDRMAEHKGHVSLSDRAQAAREVASKMLAIGLSLDGKLGKD